ncbi:hypothetical protein [Flavobacterium sp. LC2016-01]|uniref:hypothetical protein n=1 Tax=Flavobacterium sp. LC2016-01 TaxID=2675876 RepID=UPI0012BB1755|nr:hypothetical protein [Flavobacterium sp. LC2016-01]MTH17623.1 hypothetical protein [Flavobacterium sp. LC2016-01]
MKDLVKGLLCQNLDKKIPSKEKTHIVKDVKKWVWIVFFIMLPKNANAQLEYYSKFNKDGSVEPIIDYFGSKKINDHFALTFFGLTREKWAQALIGLSYSLNKNAIFYVSAGIEQGQRVPRYSSSIWLKEGDTSFLALIEIGNGPDNYLYKVNVFHQFSEKISLGLMDWRYHGLGPNFRYTISKLKLTLWVMPAYDHEEKVSRCMLGVAVPM